MPGLNCILHLAKAAKSRAALKGEITLLSATCDAQNTNSDRSRLHTTLYPASKIILCLVDRLCTVYSFIGLLARLITSSAYGRTISRIRFSSPSVASLTVEITFRRYSHALNNDSACAWSWQKTMLFSTTWQRHSNFPVASTTALY